MKSSLFTTHISCTAHEPEAPSKWRDFKQLKQRQTTFVRNVWRCFGKLPFVNFSQHNRQSSRVFCLFCLFIVPVVVDSSQTSVRSFRPLTAASTQLRLCWPIIPRSPSSESAPLSPPPPPPPPRSRPTKTRVPCHTFFNPNSTHFWAQAANLERVLLLANWSRDPHARTEKNNSVACPPIPPPLTPPPPFICRVRC